jgi:hypothetical protein
MERVVNPAEMVRIGSANPLASKTVFSVLALGNVMGNRLSIVVSALAPYVVMPTGAAPWSSSGLVTTKDTTHSLGVDARRAPAHTARVRVQLADVEKSPVEGTPSKQNDDALGPVSAMAPSLATAWVKGPTTNVLGSASSMGPFIWRVMVIVFCTPKKAWLWPTARVMSHGSQMVEDDEPAFFVGVSD